MVGEVDKQPSKPLREFTFEERDEWLKRRLQPLIDDKTISGLSDSHKESYVWTGGLPGKGERVPVLCFRIHGGTTGYLDLYVTDDYELTLEFQETGQKDAWKEDLFTEYVRRAVKANYWHMNDY